MTTIRTFLLRGDDLRQGGAELIDEWKDGAKLWVDVAEPTKETIEPLLEGRFGFHELAAEDCLSLDTLPKYDPYPTYDFFVFRAVDIELATHRCTTQKLAAFLGRDLVVTVHGDLGGVVENVRQRLPADRRLLANGPDFLLYSIVDEMVDAHFPLLDRVDDRIDELQDTIFHSVRPGQLDDLLHAKRDLNIVRRQIFPQRDLLNQISRGDAQFVARDHLIYFRDIYDHMFRIVETIDVQRDSMSGAMEAYLSVVANRTNEIMRILTVFSALMLPLTLIAGIYGMNFQYMPELHWLRGYPFALGLMAIVAVIMLLFFRRKGWIGRPVDVLPREKR